MRTRTSTPSGYQTPPPRLNEQGGDGLDLVLTTAGAGWWRWRESGGTLVAGAAIEELRGGVPTSLAQLLAQVHRDDRARVQDAIAGACEEPRRLEYRILRLDGSVRWVQGAIRRTEDGDGEAVLGVEFGIDARKRAQPDARAENEGALKANRDKEKFVYICSHDLREPLRMVSGFLGLLERRTKGIDQRGHEYLALALDGAARLNLMLEDLLTYSRCGRERHPALEPLGDALRATLAELESEIAASGAQIVAADELPAVHADREQLERLLHEVIGNAIKFRSGPSPRITVRAERGDNEWIVAVADDGIGVPDADRERVFDVFNRLHLRDAYPGNGLGLALCSKIVEQHGGRIWIEAPPDGAPGTIVKASFPGG